MSLIGFDVVIADCQQGLPPAPDSVIITIGKDGKPGQPGFWNRGDFRSIRVTNRRNKKAVAEGTISRLMIRDARSNIRSHVDV